MPLRRAKPVDDLYEEVAEYDRVIVFDGPLADAINRRLTRPRIGRFAITPRQLAAKGRKPAGNRLGFLELVNSQDMNWKAAATAVEDILGCWEHTGRAGTIIEYEQHDTEAIRAALEPISAMDQTPRRLMEYTIDPDETVAVVGYDQLSELERSILPPKFDIISPFTDEPFDRPPFRILDSASAIVDVLLETITPDNADEVAIVLDAGSEYSSLIESALEVANVPYYGGPGFADDPHHRGFLRLLRTAYASTDTRIGDCRAVLTQLGAEIGLDHDEKRLHELDEPALDWVRDFCSSIGSRTFAEVLGAYEERTNTECTAFHEELKRLGLRAEPVTEAAVDRLTFYLDTYEVPVERDNEGVLLADATSAAYVDRPLVFLVGLDAGWTREIPRRPWVDVEATFRRNLHRFQLLIQSGVDQHYLVQDAVGGRPVIPCPYLTELVDQNFERFSDLESADHARTFGPSASGFERDPLPVDPEPVTTVSQSALKKFVNCPRDYLFDRIVDGPDRHYFTEGILFHDFAEVCAGHPDAVTDEHIETVVAHMLDELAPFHPDVTGEIRGTRYRAGLVSIKEFLAANPPGSGTVVRSDGGFGSNAIADLLDLEVDSSATEKWFRDRDLGIKGMIDLVAGPDHLVDYKTGAKRGVKEVVKRSAMNPPVEKADFQALCYLTYLRTRNPDRPLRFTFVHFLEPLDDIVRGDHAVEDCLTTIEYLPVAFEEHVRSRSTFDGLREEAPNDCTKTFGKIGFEDYLAFLDEHPFPATREVDDLVESEYERMLTERMQSLVGNYKYVAKGCTQALRYLVDRRNTRYFEDELDAFESFVDERIDELNRYRSGEERYPVGGLLGEPYERYLNHPDLILMHE